MSEELLQMVDDDLPRDAMFRLLSHTHRRALINCLDDHGIPLALADAAEEVAQRNEGRSIREISAEEVKRVYMSLYHSHIPKLADEDIVQYDQDQDIVTLTGQGEQLVEVLNQLSPSNSD